MLLLASIMKVEGNLDWRESTFSMQTFDCATPMMINKLHLPEDYFIPKKKVPEKLMVAKEAWILEGEEHITLEQCMTAKKGFYNSPDGKWMQISPSETILFQYIEDGSITIHPTNTYCEGVSLSLHKSTIGEQSLVLTRIWFSMLREVYIRTRGGKTTAKFSRVSEFHSLPTAPRAGAWMGPESIC